ncbi:MAG: hypothetical protein QME79_14425 [Bacillota bacterium]|nr:hypothetical protein [Bacillota bacterium]
MTETKVVNLLPPGITPAMLRDWAEAMDKRDGRATVLSDTLRHLAEAIPKVSRKIGEMGDKLSTCDLLRKDVDYLTGMVLNGFTKDLLRVARESFAKELEGEPEAKIRPDVPIEAKVLLLVQRLKKEVCLLTTTRRRLAEEVMAQKERADRAERDRDTWRKAA